MLPALTDLPLEGWDALAGLPGAKRYTPGLVRRWVLARGAVGFDAMTDLSKALRGELAERWRLRRGRLQARHPSSDGTVGLLTRLDDDELIESVVIPEGERTTLCLSSQVGCAVACRFCASGLDGVRRNLSSGEILEQVLVARESAGAPLTNYVFMGSGEPTHNLKALRTALTVMTSPDGLGIGARRITVSTVGHPEALRRLAEIPIPFSVALSLHAPDDRSREALMPGLGPSDLAATLAAARERFEATGRRLTVEIVLLAGVNDGEAEARAFVRLLADVPVLVNLIPWNPVDGVDLQAPSEPRAEELAAYFRAAGLPTTLRRPRGRDVGVACGQLRRRASRAPGAQRSSSSDG